MRKIKKIVTILMLLSPNFLLADESYDLLKKNGFLNNAPTTGWAGMNNGTTGGNNASLEHYYIVKNISELRSIFDKEKKSPKIIQINSLIDVSEGIPFLNLEDQKKRGQVFIPSNTTLIGLYKESGFKNGTLIIQDAQNVILRNLHLEMPIDVAPKIEKDDGWNAQWDGINLINAQYIWLDHLTLTDGSFQVSNYKLVDGLPYVQHDGMIDIKRKSDFVTISWSHFKDHDKTMLIGHSDKFSEDRGKLNVTINNSIFENTSQRTPRVRYGKVHVYNNLYLENTPNIKTSYPFNYAFGLGFESHILAENNLFNIPTLSSHCDILKIWNDNSQFRDMGNILNTKPISLFSDCSDKDKKINSFKGLMPYEYELENTENLEEKLKGKVGSQNIL